ncbi:MAG: Crp/Fnr family transcriptional regulator, partial [Oxalobacteraceae bacterium]
MRVDLAADNLGQKQNALLAGLPPDEWNQLSPNLRRVPLAEQAVLQVSSEPIGHAYFLLSGYVSVLLELSDGFKTEIAQVGNEGMLGLPLVMGENDSAMTAMVQVSGEALRISAATFTTHISRSPTLHRRLLGFAGKSVSCSAQLAACNTRHPLEERLVRCLLGLSDRAQDSDLAITHE